MICILYRLRSRFTSLTQKLFPRRVLRTYNYGINNRVIICGPLFGKRLNIKIFGSNNEIIIESACMFFSSTTIYVQGENNHVLIGARCTFDGNSLLVAAEGTSINIGEDCMFAAGTTLRTSDQHPIYDGNRCRINPARSIMIGKHVWLGADSTIMKGVEIGDGSIIGFGSIVTKNIPPKCIAVGFPAQVIRTEVEWNRVF